MHQKCSATGAWKVHEGEGEENPPRAKEIAPRTPLKNFCMEWSKLFEPGRKSSLMAAGDRSRTQLRHHPEGIFRGFSLLLQANKGMLPYLVHCRLDPKSFQNMVLPFGYIRLR